MASQQAQPGGTGETARPELAMAKPADHQKLEAGRPPRHQGWGQLMLFTRDMGQSLSDARARRGQTVCSPRPHHRQDVGWTGQMAAGAAAAKATATGKLVAGAQTARERVTSTQVVQALVGAALREARPVVQLGKGHRGCVLE